MARKRKEITEELNPIISGEGIPTIEEITTEEEITEISPEVTEEVTETFPAEEEVTEVIPEEPSEEIPAEEEEITEEKPVVVISAKKANADSAKDLQVKAEIKEGQTLYLRKLNPNLPDDKTKWAVEILHGGNKRHEIFRGTLGKASLTFEKYKVKYLRG